MHNPLIARAQAYQILRDYFKARDVLEVETPLLSHASVTDLHLQAFNSQFKPEGGGQAADLYLMTSPEFHMKRLLANGSGDIFQICKAFRNGEVGRMHNPEFTILEWYRLGLDHLQLADEVVDLLHQFLSLEHITKITYQDLFLRYVDLDPLCASLQEIRHCIQQHDISIQIDDIDTGLQLLSSHCIEPQFETNSCTVIYNFPVSQAALAQVCPRDPTVAERFEVFVGSVELANGFHELADPVEQRQRFEADLLKRQQHRLPLVPIDENFLAALEKGLPDCAGVALGIDRLLMLHCGQAHIDKVIIFPYETA